jgi:hypothetical protein
MQDPGELRAAASRYRRLEAGISDRQAIQALNELADEYDALAAALEKEDFVRRRAYEIWEEQGRPHGLHAQHWAMAEQELEHGGQWREQPTQLGAGSSSRRV